MKTLTHRGPGRPVDEELATRRREEILDAAVQLFAKVGYAETDTQELADVLRVGKGTIYRYFPSKRDLFLAAVDRVMLSLRETVEAAITDIDEPLELIARGIQTYLEFFATQPEYVELLVQERAIFKDRKKPSYYVHREANVGKWRERFRNLIAEGRVRDLPPERITDLFSDLLYGTMFTNYFTGPKQSPARQARDILDMVFNGILTDSERQRRQASLR